MAVDLKVMTLNLRCDCEADRCRAGSNTWTNRLPLARQAIGGLDFVCTQEGSKSQLDELTNGSRFTWIGRHCGKKNEAGNRSEHILYKRRAWQVEDSGNFWLSDTSEVPGSISWVLNP